jgi:hypothetical protein
MVLALILHCLALGFGLGFIVGFGLGLGLRLRLRLDFRFGRVLALSWYENVQHYDNNLHTAFCFSFIPLICGRGTFAVWRC